MFLSLKTRGLTSLTLACAFAVASVSGIVLYVKPKGVVANWTGWSLGGLSKSQWEAVHTNSCLLLLLVAIVHLVLNWRVFWSYIRTRASSWNLKREMALAGLISAGVVIGTLSEIPPFTATIMLGDRIKEYWRHRSPTGPTPHAEELSIERFANSLELTYDELAAVLARDGLRSVGPVITIAELARENRLAPVDVYDIVTKHYPSAIREAGRRQFEAEVPVMP